MKTVLRSRPHRQAYPLESEIEPEITRAKNTVPQSCAVCWSSRLISNSKPLASTTIDANVLDGCQFTTPCQKWIPFKPSLGLPIESSVLSRNRVWLQSRTQSDEAHAGVPTTILFLSPSTCLRESCSLPEHNYDSQRQATMHLRRQTCSRFEKP